MFTFIFQMVNLFIVLGLILAIPLFMYVVLKTLKRIDQRLERLESVMETEEHEIESFS